MCPIFASGVLPYLVLILATKEDQFADVGTLLKGRYWRTRARCCQADEPRSKSSSVPVLFPAPLVADVTEFGAGRFEYEAKAHTGPLRAGKLKSAVPGENRKHRDEPELQSNDRVLCLRLERR